jgi:hypothetical protein
MLADLLADLVKRCADHRFSAPYVIDITDATGTTISASFQPSNGPGGAELHELKLPGTEDGASPAPRLKPPLTIRVEEFTGKSMKTVIGTKRP